MISIHSVGQYNYTYLQAVETLVNQLGSYGIYSLLDLHQVQESVEAMDSEGFFELAF
jgi:hypothetical protein